MAIPCKFRGYLLLGPDEGFKIGDYYYAESYGNMRADGFDIRCWRKVSQRQGPLHPGQSFTERHGRGFTVIRKATKKSGLPVRLVMSKVFSTPLPLP